MRNWLLPEYIEDVLPAKAMQIESCQSTHAGILGIFNHRRGP